MQKLVEALKRKEREEAAKPKETAEAFRAKFAEIYGPKKVRVGIDLANGEAKTVNVTVDTTTKEIVKIEENAPERLPDNGEVPPDPAERTRMSQESEEVSGADEDTPGTKKPVQARKSGNGKGRGKGNAGKRGQGKAGQGRKR